MLSTVYYQVDGTPYAYEFTTNRKRLPAADFQPSRDQRQALHRWNKFVLGQNYAKELTKLKPKSKQYA